MDAATIIKCYYFYIFVVLLLILFIVTFNVTTYSTNVLIQLEEMNIRL